MNEMHMFHRFHRGTGEYPVVAAIERWWRMPIDVKERLVKKWEEEDQANLHRLVDIRGFLWT